jgi:hypothetical protein
MASLKAEEIERNLLVNHNYRVQDEDINLIDLWICFRRFKKRFVLVFTVVFVAGLLHSYFAFEEKFSVVSSVQIGAREKDDAILPVESPESLLSKVKSSIIPAYTNAWKQQNDFEGLLDTESSNPKNSNVILIINKTTNEGIAIVSDFQRGLVKTIIDDHKRMINLLKSKMESELRQAQIGLDNLVNPLTLEYKLKAIQIELDDEEIKLKKLEDEQSFSVKKGEFQAQLLQAKHEKMRFDDIERGHLEQYNRIEENKKILFEKIKDLKIQLSDASVNLRSAANKVTEQSAMTQLMIANEIQKNQNQLASLEERYHIKLENEKTELMQKIEAIRLQKIEALKKIELLTDKYKVMMEDDLIMRERQRLKVSQVKAALEEIKHQHHISTTMQEEKVREIKTRLDNFNETRAVSIAVKSLKPIGMSRLKFIVMVLFLAVFVGISAVLLAAFGEKVKERLAKET